MPTVALDLSRPWSYSVILVLVSYVFHPWSTNAQTISPSSTTSTLKQTNPTIQPTPHPTRTDRPSFYPTYSPHPTSSPTPYPTSTPTFLITDEETWSYILATLWVTFLIAAVLLTVYECGRRYRPTAAVFDRRRTRRPKRTVPPLMISRGKKCGLGCGAVFECLFLSTDEEYCSYARAMDERYPCERRGELELDMERWAAGEDGVGDDGREKETEDKLERVEEETPLKEETDGNKDDDGIVMSLTLPSGSVQKSVSFGDDATSDKNGESQLIHPSGDANDVDVIETEPFETPSQVATKEVEEESGSKDLSECDNTEHHGNPRKDVSFHNPSPSPVINEETANEGAEKELPPYPSRLRYFWIPRSPIVKVQRATWYESLRRRMVDKIRTLSAPDANPKQSVRASELNALPLTSADKEMLRCIGLDSYTMIRFLRLGFDVTFYPFLIACVTIIPTYGTNDFQGEVLDETSEDGGFSTTTTNGYFSITINSLENESWKLWIPWVYGWFYYCYVLRKIWVEWEIFIQLRQNFLAHGDPDAVTEDDEESLRQFRNSCMVEYVPVSHRRDRDFKLFYETLFPDQTCRGEMLLDTRKLSRLINERKGWLAKYESVFAKEHHAKARYRRCMEKQDSKGGKKGWAWIGRRPKKPEDTMIRVDGNLCCHGEKVDAKAHYLEEIERLNGEVENEYRKIVRRKQRSEMSNSLLPPPPAGTSATSFSPSSASENDGGDKRSGRMNWKQLATTAEEYMDLLAPREVNFGMGLKDEDDPFCDNGFVEFKNRVTKQGAIQCDLTGEADWMVTTSAPDPRDVLWENAVMERSSINTRRLVVELVLLTGILFWGAVVTGITNIQTLIPNDADQWVFAFLGGYLPVLVLALLMWLLPLIFLLVAIKVIRFKAMSEVDRFVFVWHFAYRVTNFVVILVSGTLWDMAEKFRNDPELVIRLLAQGILEQSQFYLNIVVVATGQELMMQLSQWNSVLFHLFMYNSITVEAASTRFLEWLEQPKIFLFWRYAPQFLFIFLVAVVYCTMVPIMLLCCSAYFFVATKVFTHQALFVFSQPYEGGGKLVYLINRSVFVTLYVSIVVFSTILGLKQVPVAAGTFLIPMLAVVGIVDVRVQHKFIEKSERLPLTRARIMDEEQKEDDSMSLLEGTTSSIREQEEEVGDDSASLRISELTFKTEDVPFPSPTRRLERSVRARRQVAASGMSMGIGQPPLRSDEEILSSAATDDGTAATLDYFLYRQPHLNRALWETEPRPYRPSTAGSGGK